jgi:predicted porin
MKKRLITLAVLSAFVASALAQSSVTVYGIIDVGVQWNESGVNTGTTATPNWQQESAFSIDSGYQSGSRFGFRGSEALGGHWKAVFTLEGGFDASTGTSSQGGRLFGRQAWAGLEQSNLGTFAFGRIATPSSGTGAFDLWSQVDPFSAGWGLANLGSTFIPTAGLREDNSIIWASPLWAGFKFAAQWSGNVDLAESAPQDSNTSAYNFGVNWTWGPLFMAATYDLISYATTGAPNRPGAGNPDQTMLQLGGTFDIKLMKFHLAWADQSSISTSMTVSGIGNGLPSAIVPTGIGNYDNSAWMAGVTVPLFGGKLRASYQYSDAKNVINGLAQFEPDYSVWGIGFDYPLSRRTNLYLGYAQREWDGRVTQSSGLALPQASQIFDRAQFATGLRHLF